MSTVNHSDEMAKSAAKPEVGGAAGGVNRGAAGGSAGGKDEGVGLWPDVEAGDSLIHFALRSDGAILLNAADLKGFDLSGREIFVGVVLTPREGRFAMGRLANAAADAAAKLIMVLQKKLSKLSS